MDARIMEILAEDPKSIIKEFDLFHINDVLHDLFQENREKYYEIISPCGDVNQFDEDVPDLDNMILSISENFKFLEYMALDDIDELPDALELWELNTKYVEDDEVDLEYAFELYQSLITSRWEKFLQQCVCSVLWEKEHDITTRLPADFLENDA